MKRAWIAIVWLTVPAAAAGQVQMRMGPGSVTTSTGTEVLDRSPAGYGVAGWTVGQWARYNISRTLNVQMAITMQQFRLVSVVGKSGESFWVEIQDDMMSPQRQTLPIRKLLIPFGPVAEAVMSEMLMALPDSSIRRTTLVRPPHKPDDAPKPFPDGWSKVADEEISTAAGKFQATKWKRGSDALWVSPQAAPLGVVKYQSESATIELVARSETGARSKIPGVTP